jgi:hypothetical protein
MTEFADIDVSSRAHLERPLVGDFALAGRKRNAATAAARVVNPVARNREKRRDAKRRPPATYEVPSQPPANRAPQGMLVCEAVWTVANRPHRLCLSPRAHQRSTSATGEREGLAQNVGQRLRQPAARGVMTRGIKRRSRKSRWP